MFITTLLLGPRRASIHRSIYPAICLCVRFQQRTFDGCSQIPQVKNASNSFRGDVCNFQFNCVCLKRNDGRSSEQIHTCGRNFEAQRLPEGCPERDQQLAQERAQIRWHTFNGKRREPQNSPHRTSPISRTVESKQRDQLSENAKIAVELVQQCTLAFFTFFSERSQKKVGMCISIESENLNASRVRYYRTSSASTNKRTAASFQAVRQS